MLVSEQHFAKDSCTAESKAYTLEGKTERKMRERGRGEGEEFPGFHYSTLALH